MHTGFIRSNETRAVGSEVKLHRHGRYLDDKPAVEGSMVGNVRGFGVKSAWIGVAALLLLASLHSASLQDTGVTSTCPTETGDCGVEQQLDEISGALDDDEQGEADGDGRAWARRGGAWEAEESLDELRERAVRMFYHGYDRCSPRAISCV